MPVTIKERTSGRKLGSRGAERLYLIKGATTEAEALSAFIADTTEVPSTLNGYPRLTKDFDVEEIDENLFEGRAVWVNPDIEPLSQSSFTFGFDVSTENTHITQSKETIAHSTDPTKTVRDFKGAINVSEDGMVGGVDILTPRVGVTYNYIVPASSVNNAYLRHLVSRVGKVNSDTFEDFEAGELFLAKVSGSRKDTESWNLSLQFLASENGDVTIGDIPTIEDKKGWDLLWVYYETVEDNTNHCILKVPTNAYVERVYPYATFADILPEV